VNEVLSEILQGFRDSPAETGDPLANVSLKKKNVLV
jgi:hypothetical protein